MPRPPPSLHHPEHPLSSPTHPSAPCLHAHYGQLLSCFLLLSKAGLLCTSPVSPFPLPVSAKPIHSRALRGPPPQLLTPLFFFPPHSVRTHRFIQPSCTNSTLYFSVRRIHTFKPTVCVGVFSWLKYSWFYDTDVFCLLFALRLLAFSSWASKSHTATTLFSSPLFHCICSSLWETVSYSRWWKLAVYHSLRFGMDNKIKDTGERLAIKSGTGRRVIKVQLSTNNESKDKAHVCVVATVFTDCL